MPSAAPPVPEAGSSPPVAFSVLGPLSCARDGVPLDPGPLKQRLVLALLLARAGSPVSVDSLVEAVWDGDPPRTARKNVQVYVSALRRLLPGRDRLTHGLGGYVLEAGPAELDALRFDRLVRQGRSAADSGDATEAARLLDSALGLWRGQPFADLAGHSTRVREEAAALAARRLAVYEQWAELCNALGDPAAVLETIGDYTVAEPLRERLRALEITALHLAGRTGEALAVFDEVRQALARELGLPPGHTLTRLHQELVGGECRPVREATAPVVLPRRLPDFTGREDRLGVLQRVLTEQPGPLVVLTGPTGVGKTSLAVHAAHRTESPHPDGRVLVRMRADDGSPRPVAAVRAEIARLLGLRPPSPAPVPGRVGDAGSRDFADTFGASWHTALAGRRALVVLDDAPSLHAVRELLPASGRCAVLVTTRAMALPEDAHVLHVCPFTPSEAVGLLGAIAGDRRVAREAEAALRIVEAVGRLPLGVRAAGGRLRALPRLPLGRYAEQLAEDGLLAELAGSGAWVRRRFAEAWHDVPAPGRRVLTRLGDLPAGPFALEPAARVLDRDPLATRRILDHLVEWGMMGCPPGPSPSDDADVVAHGETPCGQVWEMPRLLREFVRDVRASPEPW